MGAAASLQCIKDGHVSGTDLERMLRKYGAWEKEFIEKKKAQKFLDDLEELQVVDVKPARHFVENSGGSRVKFLDVFQAATEQMLKDESLELTYSAGATIYGEMTENAVEAAAERKIREFGRVITGAEFEKDFDRDAGIEICKESKVEQPLIVFFPRDVLALLFSELQVSEISKLSRTCRRFYHVAKPLLMRTKPPKAAMLKIDGQKLFEEGFGLGNLVRDCLSYSGKDGAVHLRLQKNGIVDVITASKNWKLNIAAHKLSGVFLGRSYQEPCLGLLDYSDEYILIYFGGIDSNKVHFFVFDKHLMQLSNNGNPCWNSEKARDWYLHETEDGDVFIFALIGKVTLTTLKLVPKADGTFDMDEKEQLVEELEVKGHLIRAVFKSKRGHYHAFCNIDSGFVNTLCSLDLKTRKWRKRDIAGYLITVDTFGKIFDVGNNFLMITSKMGTNSITGYFYFVNTDVAFMSQINFGTLSVLPSIGLLKLGKGAYVFGPDGRGGCFIVTIESLPKAIVEKAETIVSANHAKLSQFILTRIATSSLTL